MRIAVLMSSYNGEQYIKEQIDSILNQKGKFNIDIYVRDDGSFDNTIHILEDYQKKGLIKFCGGENIGPAKSFLTLLALADGYDFYAFADQDDIWFENKIESAILKIEKIPQSYTV